MACTLSTLLLSLLSVYLAVTANIPLERDQPAVPWLFALRPLFACTDMTLWPTKEQNC